VSSPGLCEGPAWLGLLAMGTGQRRTSVCTSRRFCTLPHGESLSPISIIALLAIVLQGLRIL